MKHIFLVLLTLTALSGCSSWVYKYDIIQGNYLIQRDIDKLRIDMTKEQVEYVLGAPLVTNPFVENNWHYVYTVRVGKTDEMIRKEVVVHFADGKVTDVTGPFEKHEDFNTPLDAQ